MYMCLSLCHFVTIITLVILLVVSLNLGSDLLTFTNFYYINIRTTLFHSSLMTLLFGDVSLLIFFAALLLASAVGSFFDPFLKISVAGVAKAVGAYRRLNTCKTP